MIIPEGMDAQGAKARLRNITFFGFSRGCSFADNVAVQVEKRLIARYAMSTEDARKATGSMAAVYTAYSPFDEKTAFDSPMPAAIFMETGDDFVYPHLRKMGIERSEAPLLTLTRRGNRQFIVGNSNSGDLHVIGYDDEGDAYEKSRSLVDGHSLYLDTNITRIVPKLRIRTFQVRPYAHILREMLDSLLGGAHSFPSDRARETPDEIITRTASHYLSDDNIARTQKIIEDGAEDYRTIAARIRGGAYGQRSL